MSRSLLNERAGVLQSTYYSKGGRLAASGTPQGANAVPMGSFISAPEPELPKRCLMNNKKGNPCSARVVKGTELCIGHTRSLAKATK
jgi:hypothetical protein